MIKGIQFVSECKNMQEAEEMKKGLLSLENNICVRILEKTPSKPLRIQAFFTDDDCQILPEGCKKVLIPESLLKAIK